MISTFKIFQRVFRQVNIPRIPNMVELVGVGGGRGGHIVENGQKLQENYKPNISGAK